MRKLLVCMILVSLISTALFQSQVRAATTWNVPGDGTNTCTTANPSCSTIQGAINAASNGDTINVSPATYNQQLTINKNNLTIQSTSGAASTIITPPDTTAGGVFVQGDGNTFKGFTVRDYTNSTSENKIIRIHNGADNNIIRENVIQGNLRQGGAVNHTEYGILVYGVGNTIELNEIFDIGYTGIDVVGPPHSAASSTIIRNNNIHHIGIYAITIDRSPTNTITQNTISNVTGGTLNLWTDGDYYYDPLTWCWGIVIWGQDATGNIITNQTVSGLPNGIVLSSAHNTNLNNSVISNNIGIGLKVAQSGWAPGIPTGNTVTSNLIQNNGIDGVRISGTIGNGNVFHLNYISGNAGFGMNNLSTLLIDAKSNWWGGCNGPYHPVLNTSGTGNKVSDNVDFIPYLDSKCFYAEPVIAPSTLMLPVALNNLTKANNLLNEAGSLLSEAEMKNLDASACEKLVAEATELIEKGYKFRTNPIYANNLALGALQKLNQAIDCLKALLG